jgi:NAD(P)-dependent dehydrogenase (short-subunit alcohol dehydrogenase family)
MEFLGLDKVRQQLEVNVVGQVAVTQAALPLLRKSGRGSRIVFMSSMAGKNSLPFNGAYAASKHAIEAVADAFRLELAPWGMSVSVLQPGYVESKILAASDTQSAIPASKLPKGWGHYYGSYFESPPRRSSKSVAPVSATSKIIAECINSATPQTRYVVGVKSLVNMFWYSSRLPDRYIDQTLAKRAWPGRYRSKIPAE